MKTKTITVLVGKDSLGKSFGLDWLNDHFGRYLVEHRVYDDFHCFELQSSKRVRLLLTDLLLSLSLVVDIYHDSKVIARLMTDLIHSLHHSV